MKGSFSLPVLALLLVAAFGPAIAQGQSAPFVGQKPKTDAQPGTTGRTLADEKTAPQVVTIIHRLSGLKMLGLLVRSDEKLRAIRDLDGAFKLMSEVHTNVIAGLAIEDGRVVVARLPEVEAEMGSSLWPIGPMGFPSAGWNSVMAPFRDKNSPEIDVEPLEPPDLTVVMRDGKRFAARYVGLDGLTGLSILKLEDVAYLPTVEAQVDRVNVGQRLRVFAPQPVVGVPGMGRISVRLGETEGTITNVTKAPTGGVTKLKIKSPGLSLANIGGIATNDSGQTVGIVENVEQGEAVVLSAVQIRSAARRVLEKKSSVPKPWLGVGGEPIATITTNSLVSSGWDRSDAMALTQDRRGILLTFVAPDSPAAIAALQPGDVILSMNGQNIHGADDFSWQLEQAGPGAQVSFTIMHPGKATAESVKLKLSGAFFPQAAKAFTTSGAFKARLFQKHGLETVPLLPAVAENLGANGGLLIFSVKPGSEAFKAGLLPGDVIELIDGQEASPGVKFTKTPGSSITFSVVRGKQKLSVTLSNEPQ